MPPRAMQGYSDVRRVNDEDKGPLVFVVDTLRSVLKEVRWVAWGAGRLGVSFALNPTSCTVPQLLWISWVDSTPVSEELAGPIPPWPVPRGLGHVVRS